MEIKFSRDLAATSVGGSAPMGRHRHPSQRRQQDPENCLPLSAVSGSLSHARPAPEGCEDRNLDSRSELKIRIRFPPGESPRTIGPARAGAGGIKFALGGGRVRLRKENHVVRQSADFPTAGPTVRILLAPTVSQRQRPAGCSAPHSCQTPDSPRRPPQSSRVPKSADYPRRLVPGQLAMAWHASLVQCAPWFNPVFVHSGE